MMRIALILVAVLALAPAPAGKARRASSVGRPRGDLATQEGEDRRVLMRSKLAHAQKILEGVTVNNFDLISRHAGALAAAADDPLWRSLQRPEYRIYRSEFEQITSALGEAARNRNADAVSLEYVRLSLNCVRCHQCIRGETVLKAR